MELEGVSTVDKASAMERLGGDEELYGEIVEIYLLETPKEFFAFGRCD